RRLTTPSAPKPQPALTVKNPRAAGIDIHDGVHWVAVPPDCDPEPVRRFDTFTADLETLADWLTACGVDTVAMESTGVYWIPLYSYSVSLDDLGRVLVRTVGYEQDLHPRTDPRGPPAAGGLRRRVP